MEKIFIQIASYRDPQLSKTIASCINNAVNPERLTFGIVNQYAEQDTFNSDLDPYRNDPRFTFMDVIWYESNGACWARTRTQHMYKGETYTLQLDSHMRLAAGWDEYLIQCMKITGSEKPFLTAYVAAYEAETVESDKSQSISANEADATVALEAEVALLIVYPKRPAPYKPPVVACVEPNLFPDGDCESLPKVPPSPNNEEPVKFGLPAGFEPYLKSI